MNTQISAATFNGERRYSGVYQQQGRMLRDADWNELVDILKSRQRIALGDVIGSGLPAGATSLLSAAGPRFGRAYVDGIEAELAPPAGAASSSDAYDNQADFPGAPPLPGSAYVLYLDVWERNVLALQDPGLLDVALHGADTCARTQVVTQLKWCPAPATGATAACDDPTQNPTSGNATFGASFRGGGSQAPDPCDPCAETINVQAPVGNYLFRLEVHSVAGPPLNPTGLVFKWSSENGAEQHPIGGTPPDFDAPGYVYEQFDDTAEHQLGVHLATGFSPARGVLTTTMPTTGSGYVRRWDGALALQFGEGGVTIDTTTISASDGGVPLVPAADLSSHGNVTLGHSLGIALQSLAVNLSLTPDPNTPGAPAVAFVAGDYWLALVRELANPNVGVVSPEPLGETHHYLTLGSVSGGAFTPAPLSTRRFAFPRLTDLEAHDVGYTNPNCANQLLSTAATVADALDAICNLKASEVSYTGGACTNPVVASTTTVQAAIDALCGLNATEIPYTPGCEILAGAANVAEALTQLCQHYMQGQDFPVALLRLFGRGAISGLIPSVTVTPDASSTTNVTVTVNVTDGTLIDGRGYVVPLTGIPPLQTTVTSFGSGAIEVPTTVSVEQSAQAIRQGLADKNLSGLVPQEQIQPLARVLSGRTFESTAELANQVSATTGITNPEVVNAITTGLGTITIAQQVVPIEVKQWLYLVTPPGQPTQLSLSTNPPSGGLSLPEDVISAFDNPAAGPAIAAGAVCADAQREAWQMYTDVPEVMTNSNGAVCLGILGVQGDAGWTAPDDREQVFPTPAITAARWRMQRIAVYDTIKQACIAGAVNVNDIVVGPPGSASLDGQALLGGTTRTATVMLTDIVRGTNPLQITFQTSPGITAHAPVVIQPGNQSGVVTFDIADAAGPQTITAVIDRFRQHQVRFTSVTIGAPVLGAGVTSVMSGDAIGVTVGLSSAATEPIAVTLSGTNLTFTTNPIQINAQASNGTSQLTVAPGATGQLTVTATAQGQVTNTSVTAVGLNAFVVAADGTNLDTVDFGLGYVKEVAVELSDVAPVAINLQLKSDLGILLAAPTGGIISSASVAAGSKQSNSFLLRADGLGTQSVTATYGRIQVTAAINVHL
jgi:hypothetical protein